MGKIQAILAGLFFISGSAFGDVCSERATAYMEERGEVVVSATTLGPIGDSMYAPQVLVLTGSGRRFSVYASNSQCTTMVLVVEWR